MDTMTYEENLKATKRFLRRARTAAEVAAKFDLSRFAAYERLRALERNGEARQLDARDPGPQGKTGPKAARWIAL